MVIDETLVANAEEALKLKEKGNEFFKKGEYNDAITSYTEAIAKLDSEKNEEVEVFLRNRAACYLKVNKYDEAIKDCTVVIKKNPLDSKALYRRAQGYELKHQYERAFLDIRNLLRVEPKNKAAIEAASRLSQITEERLNKGVSEASAVEDMLSILEGKLPAYAKGSTITSDIKSKAINNLAALAKYEHKAKELMDTNIIEIFKKLILEKCDLETAGSSSSSSSKQEKIINKSKKNKNDAVNNNNGGDDDDDDEDDLVCCFHGICNLGSHVMFSNIVLDNFEDQISFWLGNNNSKIRRGGINVFLSLSKNCNDKTHLKKLLNCAIKTLKEAFESKNEEILDDVINVLIQSLSEESMIVFINDGSLDLFLDIAAKSVIKGSDGDNSERLRIAVALSKLIELVFGSEDIADLETEAANCFKAKIKARAQNALQFSKENSDIITSLNILSTIFSSSSKIGSFVAEQPGVISSIIACCENNSPVVQCAAAEVIAQAATNKGTAAKILMEGATQVQVLYNSDVDAVLVRAMVALAKLATVSKTSEGVNILGEGGFEGLFYQAASYMTTDTFKGLQRWAVEAMAYLTLSPEIKEEFVQSEDCMRTVISLGKTTKDKALVYAIISIIQNVTNSLPKKELTEEQKEMLKLKKFAKEHVQEDHELDKEEFVRVRAMKFVKAGLIPALVHVSKLTKDSANTRDSIARILKTVADDPQYRGAIIAAGAHLPLLSIANDASTDTMNIASQALAKIAITSDPQIVFPGQKALELVRPLVRMLDAQHELLIFEGLLALTNLASGEEDLRKRILAEEGVFKMSNLQTDENEHIQRAATEALVNMLFLPEVYHSYVTKDGKRYQDLLLWLLLSGSEDDACASAASAGLAMLTQESVVIEALIDHEHFFSIIKELAARPAKDPSFLMRSLCCIENILNSTKENAKKFMESENSIELLTAIAESKLPHQDVDCTNKGQVCLAKLISLGLIKSANKIVEIE